MIEFKHFLSSIFIVNNTLCICSVVEHSESMFTFNPPKASWVDPIIFVPIYGQRKVFKVTELVFKSGFFFLIKSILPCPQTLLHVKSQKDKKLLW